MSMQRFKDDPLLFINLFLRFGDEPLVTMEQYTIANENPKAFEFMDRMEREYPRIGAEFLKDETCVDRVFFRKNRTAKDIIREAKNFKEKIRNDAIDFNIQEKLFDSESCEVFSNCGDDK